MRLYSAGGLCRVIHGCLSVRGQTVCLFLMGDPADRLARMCAMPCYVCNKCSVQTMPSPQVGAVEFHVHTSDWMAHRHQYDERYKYGLAPCRDFVTQSRALAGCDSKPLCFARLLCILRNIVTSRLAVVTIGLASTCYALLRSRNM